MTDVFAGIPRNRLADLTARAESYSLTNAEKLALAVLTGGVVGEEVVGPLIDAALEEYGHGGYRVPVRVLGDPKRLKVVISGGHAPASQALMAHIRDAFEQCDRTAVVYLPPGLVLRVYEVTPDEVPT